MTIRTTRAVVSFTKAFRLPAFDQPQPPGDYHVEYDEESIEYFARLAWQRVGAFIHLPAINVQSATHQLVPIKPGDLEAALAKDNQTS